MSSITVWSKPACVQCNAVKRWLDKNGLAYEEKQLLDHPDVMDEFRDAGFLQAPIVESEHVKTFSGFNTDLLEAIRDITE